MVAGPGVIRLRRLSAVLLLALGLVFGWSGAAGAGSGLVASSPGGGAALISAPGTVELVFADRPVIGSAHVAVRDAAGRSLNVGDPRPSGDRAVLQEVRPAGRGDVSVAYHVVLDGGATETGSLTFSVGTGAPPARPSDPAAEQEVASHQHQVDTLSAVLLLINGAVVFGAVAMLLLRPRRTRTAMDTPGPDDFGRWSRVGTRR